VPLWTASGAGAVARQIMGTAVIGGMTAATAIAIFIIPALFVMVETFASRWDSKPQHEAVLEPRPMEADLRETYNCSFSPDLIHNRLCCRTQLPPTQSGRSCYVSWDS